MNNARSKDYIRLFLYFVLFIILGMAEIFNGIHPFYIGLFVALVYCRQNMLLLAPLYIVAMLITDFSWQTFVLAISPVLIIGLGYYLHYLFKRRLKIWHIMLYAFISQIPAFFIYGTSYQIIIDTLIRLSLSQVFTLSSIIICYAVLVRGLRYRLTIDEALAGGIFVIVLSLGLYCIAFQGVRPFYYFLSLLILFAVYVFAEKGIIICLLIGIGAASNSVEIYLIALTASAAILAYSLTRTNPYIMAFAVVSIDIVFRVALNLYADNSYINSILFAGGALTFACVPQKVKSKLSYFSGTEKGYAVKTIVNRNRLELYTKLTGISSVLFEMQGSLVKDIKGMPPISDSKNFLAMELATKYCGNCPRRSRCENALCSSTASVIYDLVSRAVDKGRVTIVDVPPFLTEMCVKVKEFLRGSQEIADMYSSKKEISDSIDNTKLIMSEQVSGIAGMLMDLAKEVKSIVTFDSEREARLIDELAYKNVVASEAAVYTDGETQKLTVVVREEDANKAVIAKAVSRIMHCPMILSDKTPSAGTVSMSFVSAPKYDIIYGESNSLKEGSDKSGDTKTVIRLSTDKVLIAICDGMGSGREAAAGSNSAISLVESFYKAGIDDSVILSLINKLLSVRNEENFQTLDMCVINLRKGYADFIKLGAPESVIRNKENIDIIKGGALPLGILDNVKPFVTRKFINSGDMIVLFSDGISDNIGAEGVARICEQNKTTNPETLAEFIVEDAEYIGKGDDKTVICCRMFYRI